MSAHATAHREQVSPLAHLTRGERWWRWPLLALAAVYLAIVAHYFDHILANVVIVADASSAQVIGELHSHAAASNTYLGNMPWYSTLIFEMATGWLPGHRQIWEAGPYAFGLGAIALATWTTAQVVGRRLACLTAVLLVCASPAMLSQMFWLNDHATSNYSLVLLAALLILMQTRADSLRRATAVAVSLGVGVLVGVNMASDDLLTLAGPASLLIACAVAWRLHPSERTARAGAFCAIAAAAMVATAPLTTALMHADHIFPAPFSITFASSEAIATNVRDWWQSVALLGNGSFFGEAVTPVTVLSAICATLSVLTILLIPRWTWRHLKDRSMSNHEGGGALSAYLVFWAGSVVLVSAAFIFSSLPVETQTSRYLTSLPFAAAAIVPVFARRGTLARAAVILGTAIFAFTSARSLLTGDLISQPTEGPTPQVAREIATVAERLGATEGYAQYWDAAPLTWSSDFRIRAYPVFACRRSPMCPGPLNFIASWYQPHPEVRSFLVTDSTQELYVPPRELGRAFATYTFGTVTMRVYDYDITSDIRWP